VVRIKEYISADVLTEAKRRINHIFDIFDAVAVCFSGGKDSLAVLHLAHEVAISRGITAPINVIFRDEEVIPNIVIDFVNGYRQLPWVNMYWYCVPLQSSKYILGRTMGYVQWDPARPWVRPRPDFGICLPKGDGRVFDQYTMDAFTAAPFRGKIAYLTGIRASESLTRFRASVNKLHDNYINASSAPNVSLCKPIFDWAENDVFRYFYDSGVHYCAVYDRELWGGHMLRVATPLHAENAKRLHLLRAVDPEFYDKVLQVFPEMEVQARYYGEVDQAGAVRQYGQSYDGVRAWITQNITDSSQLALALKRLDNALIRARSDPSRYPPDYLLNVFMRGDYKRKILSNKKSQPGGKSRRRPDIPISEQFDGLQGGFKAK
jgi:predicted phosphoadenosine phosphosulfate sulfurtransferase